MAPAATSAGTLSAAGEALHRLPPAEARPWTWVEPIRLIASTTPGQVLRSFLCSPITAAGVAAPMRKPPPFSVMATISGIFLTSTMAPGVTRARLHLDQQVGAAGQDAALALGLQHQLGGVLGVLGDLVLHVRHASASPLRREFSTEDLSKRTAGPRASRTFGPQPHRASPRPRPSGLSHAGSWPLCTAPSPSLSLQAGEKTMTGISGHRSVQ